MAYILHKNLGLKVGEYSLNGETKAKWLIVGKLMRDSKTMKEFILLDAMHLSSNINLLVNIDCEPELAVSIFDVEDKRDKARSQLQHMRKYGDKTSERDDDIPF